MSADSLWQAIANTLRDEIAGGRFGPGERLPGEHALATRFGVNRHTLRRAVAALVAEGLLRVRRGAGIFAAAHPAEYPLGLRVRFTRNLAAAGRIPGRRITSLFTGRADAAEAAALGLIPGDSVHVCEGVSLADSQPLAVFRSVFPADRLPDLPALLSEEGSVTRALQRHGIDDYTRSTTRLTAVTADAAQSELLALPRGAPLMLALAVNVDPQGNPIEYGTTWFAGERIALVVEGAERG